MDNEKLISAIYERRPLWDRHSKNYNNRDTTRQLWVEVTSLMGGITSDIKKKWGNLRDQFRKEYIRLNKLAGYVKDYDTKGKSSWTYYDTLLFLSNQINLQGNLTPNQRTIPPSVEMIQQTVASSPVSIQPQPLSSPHFESTCNSEFSVPTVESFRKRERPLDMDEDYLELARKKLQLIESRTGEMYAYDPDRNFLMSLLPYLKEIPRRRKILIQQKLLQVFNEEDNRVTSALYQDLQSDYQHPCMCSEETNQAYTDEKPSTSKNLCKTFNETSIYIKTSPPSSPAHPDIDTHNLILDDQEK